MNVCDSHAESQPEMSSAAEIDFERFDQRDRRGGDVTLVGYVRIQVSDGHELAIGGSFQTREGTMRRPPSVWESTDGGVTFRLVAERMHDEEEMDVDGMMGVAMQVGGHTRLRIFGSRLGGAAETYRVFDSDDLGRSWKRVPLAGPCGVGINGGLVGVGADGALFVRGGMSEYTMIFMLRSDDQALSWRAVDAPSAFDPLIVCRKMPAP